MKYEFPENFEWGVATAAYQIEGGWDAEGKGESIWDRFSRTPGRISDGTNADEACDFFHRYEEDIRLAEELKIQVFRLSISWPRILPEGTGRVNQAGIDFYRRVLTCLHEHGMRTAVTLYHWDLPQKLQERGGWMNRESADWFAEFAEICFQAFGDLVDRWITLNEPQSSAMGGHFSGGHAPGIQDYSAALTVVHNLLRAHGRAVRLYRETGLTAKIGIALDMHMFYPEDPENEQDVRMARLFGQQANELYGDPVLLGHYPEELFRYLKSRNVVLPDVQPGDMELISAPVDFVGLNTYWSDYIRYDGSGWPIEGTMHRKKGFVTDCGWEVVPEGMHDLLVWFYERYRCENIYITENGCACNDWVGPEGSVQDPNRISYLKEYMAAAHRAMEEGVPLKGYYLWTFTDNFEWAWGKSCRFGIVYLDYETQRRIPKASALWFRDVIENHGFEV